MKTGHQVRSKSNAVVLPAVGTTVLLGCREHAIQQLMDVLLSCEHIRRSGCGLKYVRREDKQNSLIYALLYVLPGQQWSILR